MLLLCHGTVSLPSSSLVRTTALLGAARCLTLAWCCLCSVLALQRALCHPHPRATTPPVPPPAGDLPPRARRQLVEQPGPEWSSTATNSTTVSPPLTTASKTPQDHPPGHMSPHAHHMETLWSLGVVVLVLVVTALGVLTCLAGHSNGRGDRPSSCVCVACHPPPTLPMLALQQGGMEQRELGAQRDRQVRLHSVQTDLELDLPPSIALPDGEEIPYGSSTRLHIRDSEQESEIYQKCIRAPPNRTVFEGESPPPYRSSSAGLLSLGSASSGSCDWSHSVVRCHSMSSRYPPPPHLPPVIVPSRQRLSTTVAATPSPTSLSRLTMVPCLADSRTPTTQPSATPPCRQV